MYMASLRLRMDRVTKESARFLLSQLDLASCLDLRSMPVVAPELFAIRDVDNQDESFYASSETTAHCIKKNKIIIMSFSTRSYAKRRNIESAKMSIPILESCHLLYNVMHDIRLFLFPDTV